MELIIYLVKTLSNLYIMLVLLRFLLQVARADFYNPLSQFIVKATNPLLSPLRRIIPGLKGLDLAALVLAFLLQFAVIAGLLLLTGYQGAWLYPALWAVLALISLVLNFYFIALLVSIVASWVAPMSYHPALVMIRQLVEPMMSPLRRLNPSNGWIRFFHQSLLSFY